MWHLGTRVNHCFNLIESKCVHAAWFRGPVLSEFEAMNTTHGWGLKKEVIREGWAAMEPGSTKWSTTWSERVLPNPYHPQWCSIVKWSIHPHLRLQQHQSGQPACSHHYCRCCVQSWTYYTATCHCFCLAYFEEPRPYQLKESMTHAPGDGSLAVLAFISQQPFLGPQSFFIAKIPLNLPDHSYINSKPSCDLNNI